jgi:hypothetical protein
VGNAKSLLSLDAPALLSRQDVFLATWQDAKPNIPVAVLVEFETVEDLAQFCASYDDNRVRAQPSFGTRPIEEGSFQLPGVVSPV